MQEDLVQIERKENSPEESIPGDAQISKKRGRPRKLRTGFPDDQVRAT